jgi:hypothetical protein
MLEIGRDYFCRVGEFIYIHTTWRVEGHHVTHWVARSRDSFEIEFYVNDDGRVIGSRDLGMYDHPVNVYLVPTL